MKSRLILIFFILLIIFNTVGAPPVKDKKPEDDPKSEDGAHSNEIFGVEYARYLQEVVNLLEGDETFKSKLQNATEDDIKSGRIAHELQFVSHNVRTKLDEIKRQEIDRIRKTAREQMELSQGLDRRHLKIPRHLDHRNQKSFEIEDLKKLIIQTTKDLEDVDRKRKEEFKEYEMEKERLRLEKLKALDEEHRRQAELEFQEQQKKHKDHPRLHHPGSKQQLEEVWEKQDHLPADEFNPKLFFQMHDLNGDNHWSQDEVNALFQNELNKMYDMNAPEDDIRERFEEMERMREHVFNETDTNHDNLISFDEFMFQSNKQDFQQDPGWQTLDEGQVYGKEEYEEYERRRQEEMARLAAAGINPYGGPMGHPGPGYMPPPNVNPGPIYQPISSQGQMHYPQQPIQPQQGYPPMQGQHPQGNYQQGMHSPYQQEQQSQFQQKQKLENKMEQRQQQQPEVQQPQVQQPSINQQQQKPQQPAVNQQHDQLKQKELLEQQKNEIPSEKH